MGQGGETAMVAERETEREHAQTVRMRERAGDLCPVYLGVSEKLSYYYLFATVVTTQLLIKY